MTIINRVSVVCETYNNAEFMNNFYPYTTNLHKLPSIPFH